MSRTPESRRRDAPSAADERSVAEETSRAAASASRAGSGAVVRRLMGRPDPLPAPAAPLRTALRWMLGLLLAAVVVAPAAIWWQFESSHVTSVNAAVRGHLARIGARADGIVESFAVDAGDRVSADQVLVRLEDAHYRAEVQEAEAELDGLERELEVQRLSIAHQRRKLEQQREEAAANVEAAAAKADAAEIRAENARQAYEMRRSLHERNGAISGQDVRDAENARRTAEAQLREARANHVAARSANGNVRLDDEAIRISERRIGVLEADIARARAQLARARANLAGAVIRAPRDGAVVRRIALPGSSVNVGQPIIAMLLGDEVWVEAWIEESDIGMVEVGSVATVNLHSYPDRDFKGRVEKIGLTTDLEIPASEVPQPRQSRMRGAPVVGVRISLDDPPARLLPGSSADVAIHESGG